MVLHTDLVPPSMPERAANQAKSLQSFLSLHKSTHILPSERRAGCYRSTGLNIPLASPHPDALQAVGHEGHLKLLDRLVEHAQRFLRDALQLPRRRVHTHNARGHGVPSSLVEIQATRGALVCPAEARSKTKGANRLTGFTATSVGRCQGRRPFARVNPAQRRVVTKQKSPGGRAVAAAAS